MCDNPLLEVGYPLTVRGFDFDYVGILWLDDLIYRKGKWLISIEHTSYDKGPTSKRVAAKAQAKQEKRFVNIDENGELKCDKKGSYLTPEEKYPDITNYCNTIFSNYLVILTRAIKGNIVYIKDEKTRNYIRSLLEK